MASAARRSEQPDHDGVESLESVPIAARIVLGARLRRLRENAGVSAEQAAIAIRASRAKINRLEVGGVAPKPRDVADLLTLYGIGDDERRERMLVLTQYGAEAGWWRVLGDAVPSWFETYIGLEEAASLIRGYQLQFVPGLLQTPDYAREMIRRQGPDRMNVERRTEVRLRRQALLELPDAPVLWMVLDETALRRLWAGRAAQRAQLDHLIAQTENNPRVRLQIATFDRGAHPAVGGSFTLLRFDVPDIPDVVYVEHLTAALYLDRRPEVERYNATLDLLCAGVEPVERTAEIIARIRDEL